MNNTLIVLGNGFDLFRGMKTKYTDYLDKKLLDAKYDKNWRKAEEELKKFVDLFDKDISGNVIQLNKIFDKWDNAGLNFWDLLILVHKFFEQEYPAHSWYDVETMIYEEILRAPKYDQTMLHQKNSFVDTYHVSGHEWDSVNGFIQSYLLIRQIHDIDEVFDYERPLDIQERANIEIDVLQMFSDELKKFENSFSDYLISIGQPEYTDEIERGLRKLFAIQHTEDEDAHVHNNNVNVLTFNYTKLPNDIANNVVNKIRFVHGALGENIDESNIIFGVDNANIDSNDFEKYKFTKAFRIFTNPRPNNSTDVYADVLAEKPDTVKFFGHSLSAADRTYLYQIFDRIELTNYNSAFNLVFYVRPYDQKNIDQVKNEAYNQVAKLLNEYAQARMEKELSKDLLSSLVLRDKIHIEEL